MTMKRIITDLNIKKPSAAKIPTFFYKKCDFILDTVTVCSKKALKTESSPDSLKRANVRAIYKKWIFLIQNIIDQWVYYHFYRKFVCITVIYDQVSNYFEPFFNEVLCGFRKARST